MPKSSRLTALFAAVLLSACGGDALVVPRSDVRVDLAQVFRELSVPGIQGAMAAAGGVPIPATSSGPSGCNYAAATQMFVCPSVTSAGITITQSYSVLNAAGGTLSLFDAATVAAVRVRSTVSGAQALPTGETITVDGQQDQTLSGLLTSTHLLNGTSTMNLSGTLKSGLLPGAFTSRNTTTVLNLAVPSGTGASSSPASGTVTMDMVSTFAGAPTVTSQSVMKFNGTSKVTVTITINGMGLLACTIDLAASAPACS